ncbi:MAG: hypothetical protein JOZ10_03825 [Acidobacteria bacterium]|nr:hypothetical protein [Acidobacteriota bacterium]MBV9147722.1 hypothetical protein [Acidobacteriota bacterium]
MKSLLILLLALHPVFAQDAHHEGVVKRGDNVMGFSHEKTTHHFELLKDGGLIRADADNPNDVESRDQIRMHMQHIASMFSSGNFNAPMLIHEKTPPGVPTMKRLRKMIQYRIEPTPTGAEVRISTANPQALEAVHQFLRFQIEDHQTGDSEAVR